MIRIRRIKANNFKQLRDVDLFLPPQGRFLVQGKNEAGKSTLFEAVFFGIFGQPLVTETGSRRLDDLIGYGVQEAYVEIWLDAPDRQLKIRRTVVRDKANVWELDILSPDGVEEVRGNRVANQRIVQELGFDGEALLNTAFVEQKKLDKLEGMSRAQREQSLMKLLNLERMTELANTLKLRAEDRLALQRAEQRAELAAIQQELPAREEELARIEIELLRIHLKRALETVHQERCAIAELDGEIEELSRQRAALEQEVQRAEQLRQQLQAAREAYTLRERASDLEAEIRRLESALTEAEKLRDEELPRLERDYEALTLLRDRLDSLEQAKETAASQQARVQELTARIATAEETAAKLEQARERQRELQATLAEEQERLQELDYRMQAHRIRAALEEWIAAQEGLEAPAHQAAALEATRQAHAHLARRMRGEVVGLSLAIGLAVLLGWAMPQFGVGFFAVAALLLALLAWRILDTTQTLSSMAAEIGRLEGEQQAHEADAERHRATLQAAEERLLALNALIPATLERGRNALAELQERIGEWSFEALQAEADAVRERLARAQALHEQAGGEAERLERELEAADLKALRGELTDAEKILAEMEGTVRRLQERVQVLARAVEIEPERGAVQGRLGRLEAELQGVRQRVTAIEGLQAQVEQRRQELEELWTRIESLYTGLAGSGLELPAWRREEAENIISTAGQTLRQAYEAAGGDALRERLQAVQATLGRKEGERTTRQERAATLLQHVRADLQQLGLGSTLPENPSDDDLARLSRAVEDARTNEEESLRQQRDQLRERVGYLRQQRQALETTLGLEGEVLDVEETRQELERKRRELQVREKGLEIVELARRRVVEQILPTTMERMRLLLPVLTMERYFDAELTDEYRIRVWDERAGQQGDWKEKNIFSGGTRDQFSLALRLAFALATLPEERGAAPSFIFLDEPLGSFDDERTQALLYLLTEGEIARSFDQIFLISHVRVNPELFNYHIVIDQGRIVESDLPVGSGG
jgi:exonuclease SbcC